MTSAESQYLDAAGSYRDLGFAVVPTKGKDAFLDEWQQGGIPPKEDQKYFGNGHAYNIGLVLGSASDGLVDLDRDKPTDGLEPIHKMFLPDTLASGRDKRPHSHFWYFSEGLESRGFFDVNGKKFLEIRSNGHQTVV